MLRPLAMNNNLRFTSKSIEGGTNNNKNFEEISDMAESLRQKSMKDKVQSAFLVGTAVGAIISATGAFTYQNAQLDSMLRDMAAEVAYEGVDSIGVVDVNKDKHPDIVLYGSDGASTVYDIKNNNVYFDMDGELIEAER